MFFCIKTYTFVQGGNAVSYINTYHLNTDRDSCDHKRSISYDTNCFLYILRGNGILKNKEGDHPLHQGQCCLIHGGSFASYWAESEDGWEYIWITFDGPLFAEILPKIAFSAKDPVYSITDEQAKYFIDISKRKYSSRSGEHYYTIALLVQLLSSLVSTYPSNTLLLNDGTIDSIIAFIHNNLDRSDLTVTLLAQVTGFSRTTLYGKFKKELGCSPSEYIQNKRIAKARYLLRTTKMSITQIANAVGYENPLYFSRVFQKQVNTSPTAYRAYFYQQEKKHKL